MKVIAVWNYKGGVGKSTLSVNLAHALNRMGLKTEIYDDDPQGSSRLAFDENVDFPFVVSSKESDINPKNDVVLVDFRPGVTGEEVIARTGAELIVIPMLATVPDYHAAKRGIDTLHASAKLIPVLNRYDAGSMYEREVKELIQETFPELIVIPKRSAFANANNDFRTVYGFDFRKQKNMREAAGYIDALAEAVIEQLK